MVNRNLKINTNKNLLLKDLKNQFPELKDFELENLLSDLRRIPELFKKLITETQVNLRTYERYKKGKKIRTDYKLDLDTVLNIKDGTETRK